MCQAARPELNSGQAGRRICLLVQEASDRLDNPVGLSLHNSMVAIRVNRALRAVSCQ